MLYTFYVKLTSFDDDQLSYKLFKHPDNVYERDHSNVKIVGKFTRTNGIVDDKSYEILMYQETDEILYNKISWNFVELSALSLRELNIVFNNVLRAAVRSKHEENLSVEQMTSSNHYKLELLPVDPGAFTNIEKMGKYVEKI